MPCSITFSIADDGKIITKVKWGEEENPKNINKFRKLLKDLQSGDYNIDICEAVIGYSNKISDRETGKKILRSIAEKETFDNAVLLPYEMTEEIK